VDYPVCTDGNRASVPEDSGGVGGYMSLGLYIYAKFGYGVIL